MPPKSYLDFDLLIEPATTGYRARVLNSPSGQAVAAFSLPFTANEQTAIESASWSNSAARHLKPTAATTPPLTPESFGKRLFEALFQGEVLTCLTRSLEIVRLQNAGLRIRLRLNQTPELALLPWEYLYHPAPYGFFALSAATPIVRYVEASTAPASLEATDAGPLRVLAVLSNPADELPLQVEEEWRRLETAINVVKSAASISLERLEGATLAHLQRRLQRLDAPVHVLHFIGHGDFDKTKNEGGLWFEDAQKQPVLAPADSLAALLYNHHSLRLAFLNACEGARAGRENIFAGVAQTLVEKGMPAVIAMQYKVSDQAALTLAPAFYQAVAAGYPIDAALAEARLTLYTHENRVEWGTPVLFMRAADGRLWQTKMETKMAEKKGESSRKINTGGGMYVERDVNVSNGDFVGNRKITYGDDIQGHKVGGDLTIGTVGNNAGNVVIGKGQTQINIGTIPTDPGDSRQITAALAKLTQALTAVSDQRKAIKAEVHVETLQQELTKMNGMPNGGAITNAADWLLQNVPEITEAVGELLGLPAVGRLLAKAGDAAKQWWQGRFGQ